jgi:heat-inducible transcriptional repressor
MTTITKRQEQILKVIVREYSQFGQPVGSKTVVDSYNLNVSSATVRNDMVELEQQGLLRQPHTSAGRVPTEAGYRYFVSRLMGETELMPDEQLMIRHQFHQARLELDQWMRLSAAVLAHTTESASWVTSPKISECRLKHIELISVHDRVALLILVLKEGSIKQQILNLEMPHTQDELRTISRHLTELWADADNKTISTTKPGLDNLSAQISDVVLDAMTRISQRQTSDMYHDGLLHIIQTAEWNHQNVLEQVIRVVEEQQFVDQLVGQAVKEKGVQIIIGGEGQWDDLSQVSIVLSRYGIDNGATGALGVMGPIRMRYGRAVSIVRYMSYLMSDLMVDLYGHSTQES